MSDPRLGQKPWLFPMLAMLGSSAVILSFIVVICAFPLAPCPNCTGPSGEQEDGTYGYTTSSGKTITLGCFDCTDKKVTLLKKWTWPRLSKAR
jgi:hypothetical protein